jgi:hypothetical protein
MQTTHESYMSKETIAKHAARRALIKEAGLTVMVHLFFDYEMHDDCLMCHDSGGRNRYVVGRLDNGKPFAAKCPRNISVLAP